jgi:O-antigen/teichoic acid export membrane protein
VLRDVATFAGSQYFLRLAGLVKGFIVARVLGPTGNGLWQHFVIISEYAQYSQLGALQGLNKVLGHRIGRGDEVSSAAARDTGTGAVMGSAILLWLALCAWVALRWEYMDPADRWGLPLLGLVVVFEQASFLTMTVLRAHSRIGVISAAETVFALSNLIVSVALMLRWGAAGLLVGWLASRAATTWWMVRRGGYGFRPALVPAELRALLWVGTPIYLFQLTRVGIRNIDRVLVDSVLDRSMLGIYGLAVTIASLVRYVADAIGFVVYPLFLRSYGETGDARAARSLLTRPTELLALLVPIALGASYLLLHLPVLWLLPEFIASIEIYRLLTLSMAFQCLAVLPGFYLMAIDRQNGLVPLGLAAIGFDYFGGRWMIEAGWGLPGVALTMGVGSFLYCTVILLHAGTFAWGSARLSALWTLRLYAPLTLFAALVAALRWTVTHTPLAVAGETLRATVEGAAFLGVALPVLAAYERRHGVLRTLRRRRTSSSDSPPED